MSDPAEASPIPPPWAPLLEGFRRHGLVGKIYMVLHSLIALALVLVALFGSSGYSGIIVLLLAVAAVQLGIVAGVALHNLWVLIIVFALSILAWAGCLYAMALAWHQPLELIERTILLVIDSTFVWYFGRLQRARWEGNAESEADGQPTRPGAV